VLWAAADEAGRQAIWDAHHAGVDAALAYLEREAAWSRAGHSGIRSVDTTGWVVASFDHRMSRSGDVQIHTHNAVLNRVRCSDGQWRSLDARAVYRVAASAGALYDRVREAALEASLGVRHEVRKEGGAREIVGVPEVVCRLFSTRRGQVTARVGEMAESYEASHGHGPSDWLRSQMAAWATLQTRQKKVPGHVHSEMDEPSMRQTGHGRLLFPYVGVCANTQMIHVDAEREPAVCTAKAGGRLSLRGEVPPLRLARRQPDRGPLRGGLAGGGAAGGAGVAARRSRRSFGPPVWSINGSRSRVSATATAAAVP